MRKVGSYSPVKKAREPGYYGPLRRDIKIQPPHFKDVKGPHGKNDMVILAFDPGGTTGWSLIILPRQIKGRDVFSWDPDTIVAHLKVWEHGELVTTGDEDGAAYQMAKMCLAWPAAAIVVEDFILRAERKEKSRDLLSPVRITAKLEAHLWLAGKRMVHKQQASQAKTTCTDDRLAMWGCLAEDGLPDHARDADRHALLFLRRCRQQSTVRRAAWPHLYAFTEGEDRSA